MCRQRSLFGACADCHEERNHEARDVRRERKFFLGRMSQLSDGMSFVLETNPGQAER